MKFFGYFAIAALSVGLLGAPAKAATWIADGGSYDLLADDYFFEFNTSDGSSQDFSFNFYIDSSAAPQPGMVVNLTLTGIGGSVENPAMVWSDSNLPYSDPGYIGGTVYETAVFTPAIFGGNIIGQGASLSTIFDTGKLSQWLNVGYNAFSGSQIQISLQVSAVPLPGAAWLFGTALLGGGIVVGRRRRRRAIATG